MYRPGKTCIADYLSRHHSSRKGSSPSQEVEMAVKSIMEVNCCHVVNEFSAVTIENIRAEAEKCEVYKRLREAIQSGGEVHSDELKAYMIPEVKNELCVIEGVVCRG